MQQYKVKRGIMQYAFGIKEFYGYLVIYEYLINRYFDYYHYYYIWR